MHFVAIGAHLDDVEIAAGGLLADRAELEAAHQLTRALVALRARCAHADPGRPALGAAGELRRRFGRIDLQQIAGHEGSSGPGNHSFSGETGAPATGFACPGRAAGGRGRQRTPLPPSHLI